LRVFRFFELLSIFEVDYLGILELNFFHLAHIDASIHALQLLFHVVHGFRDVARRS